MRSDGTRLLTYLTGHCQQKHRRMKCHLNEITVNKLDTTLRRSQGQGSPGAGHTGSAPRGYGHRSVTCRTSVRVRDQPRPEGGDRTERSPSPAEQELRQATRQFCAAKTVDNLRALLDLRLTLQERTCALGEQL